METISKLESDEKIWIQLLIKPADDSCKRRRKIVNKLIGKKRTSLVLIGIIF